MLSLFEDWTLPEKEVNALSFILTFLVENILIQIEFFLFLFPIIVHFISFNLSYDLLGLIVQFKILLGYSEFPISSADGNCFISSFLVCMPFILFSCLIMLASTSITMLIAMERMNIFEPCSCC